MEARTWRIALLALVVAAVWFAGWTYLGMVVTTTSLAALAGVSFLTYRMARRTGRKEPA